MRQILFGLTAITMGCSGNGITAPAAPIDARPVEYVAVQATNSLEAGTSFQLIVTLLDATRTEIKNRVITFTSSDESVATVSSTGVVQGRLVGTSTITATSEGKRAQISLQVVANISGKGYWDY